MIYKSYKDLDVEIVMQQDEVNGTFSISLLKNACPAEFQGNLDFETALEIYDYYFDLVKGNDLSTFEGYEIK